MSKKNNRCNKDCKKKTSIGGQALIEGIMMRGPGVTAMAVRDPEGNIVLEKWRNSAPTKSKLRKFPFIRGVFGFIDSMKTGYKSLMRSAEISGLEEAEAELQREKEEKKAAKAAKRAAKKGIVTADGAEEQLDSPVETVPVTDLENEASGDSDTPVDDTTVVDATDAREGEEVGSEETEANTEADKKAKKSKKEKKEKKDSSMTTAVMVVSVIFAVIIFVGLFMALPTFLYGLLSKVLPEAITGDLIINSIVKSAFEGVMRIILLVGYMLLVTLMKDIRRTFMYHGAEHKTIFCYEHGNKLTVENVKKERRFHPRCGTSFLILMVLVSIFVSFFIDPILVLVTQNPAILDGGLYFVIRTCIKVLFIAPVMGIGYELIKLAGKYDNILTRIISAPGVWLQHLTVFEPTDDMIECAIAAFVEVMPENERIEMFGEPESGAETDPEENSEENAAVNTEVNAEDNAIPSTDTETEN